MVDVTPRTSRRRVCHIANCSIPHDYPFGLLIQSCSDRIDYSGIFTEYSTQGQISNRSRLSMIMEQHSSSELD